MAALVDASSPVRWSGVDTGTNVVSASFTAPADALLVLCNEWDTSNASPIDATTVSDTGGLTWTQQVARTGSETTVGGGSGIWTARTTSSVSRTVQAKYPSLAAGAGTKRISCKLYVVTGADVNGTPVDTVGANNENGSATNNLTTTPITAGADGLLFCSDTDWNVLGVFTSSDLTIDTADYPSQISVCSGYKAVASGASVSGNLNAGGTAAAQHKWVQIVVRAAAGAPVSDAPAQTLPPNLLAL